MSIHKLKNLLEEIKTLLLRGLNQSQIAKKLDVSTSAISVCLRRNGIPTKGRPKPLNFDINVIRKLRLEGKTQHEIALILGAKHDAVIGVLMKRNNIPTRISLPKRPRELHPRWKGENAGYQALHERVRVERGTPRLCDTCKVNDDISKKYEWANMTGNYTDIWDYKRLCSDCHRSLDAKRRRRLGHKTTLPHFQGRPAR